MKSTCAILIFCATVYFAASDFGHGRGHGHDNPHRAIFMGAKTKCLKEYPTLNGTDMRKLLHDEKYPEGIPKDDVDCFFKCFMVELGSMDEETGEIMVPDDLKNNPNITEIFTTLCANPKGENDCERAYVFQKCFAKKRGAKGRRPPHHHNHPNEH